MGPPLVRASATDASRSKNQVLSRAKSRLGAILFGTGLDRRQRGEWIANGEEEGLPSDMIYTVFQDSRGRVWAGCSRGISLYYPEADLGAPRVGFAAAGNTHQATPQGDIRIILSGTDRWKFTPADRLLYSYALDSGGWTPFAAARPAPTLAASTGPCTTRRRA